MKEAVKLILRDDNDQRLGSIMIEKSDLPKPDQKFEYMGSKYNILICIQDTNTPFGEPETWTANMELVKE